MSLPDWAMLDHSWEEATSIGCAEPIYANSYRCSACELEADHYTNLISGNTWVEYYNEEEGYDISLVPTNEIETCAARTMRQALE